MYSESSDMYRLQGQLAVSRSVGDILLKNYMITEACADKYENLDDIKYIFMACDGIFDVITPEELPELLAKGEQEEPENLAKYFINLSKSRMTKDNLSVIVMKL